MQLVCPTEPLARATKAVARLPQEKEHPGSEAVLLQASSSSGEDQGLLTVLGWNPQRRAGLFATFPVQVEQPGQVCVNASWLAGYLAPLRAPVLHLSQEAFCPEQELSPVPAMPGTELAVPTKLPPLQVACTWTSDGGQEIRRRARFRAHVPTEFPDLPLAAWRRTGMPIATLPARALQAALATCAPLALSRDGKEQLPDLFGILVRFDPEGLLFTATTPWDLASQRIAVPLAPRFTEPFHMLFTGANLVWLSKLLRDEEQIHLTLVREEEQAVLLVDTSEGTLFCTGRTTRLPTFWEQMPLNPVFGRLRIEREAFVQAIGHLATAAREDATAYIRLTSAGDQLLLQLVDGQDGSIQFRTELPITSAMPSLPAILLDPGRAGLLVRKLQGAEISLEWGSLLQQSQGQQQVVGFLRMVSVATGSILVMARSDVPGENDTSPEALAQPSEVQETPTAIVISTAMSTQPRTGAPGEASLALPPLSHDSASVARKESFMMSSALPSLLTREHVDEALSQLALYYHRQALQASLPPTSREACAWIRDQLLAAPSQQAAWELLQAPRPGQDTSASDAALWEPFCQQAAGLLRQVLDAGGSLQPLIVGVTDGFRHFCLHCGQDTEKREAIRFFRERDRRWLLSPEIGSAPRSVYERCQSCLQPLYPTEVVVFAPAGTVKHSSGCSCQHCNQRALAFVLIIYACDRQTQQIVLPHLAQVTAPSRQQCVERAVALCWREGWYMRSEDPHAHALSALALAPVLEENLPAGDPII